MNLKLYGGQDPRQLPAYTMQAAAHHTGVPLPTLKSWVKGRPYPVQAGTKFFEPIIILPENSSLLSFTNLIEVHVLNAIRRKENVRMPNVRAALDFLSARFDSKHPLAEHEFQTDGLSLFIEHLGEIINVSKSGQVEMRELLEAHLRRIERDPKGYAIRLYPFVNRTYSDLNKHVSIDPFVSFGRPVLSGTGITTALIAERFIAGDSIEKLSQDYQRNGLEIQEAIRFERLAA